LLLLLRPGIINNSPGATVDKAKVKEALKMDKRVVNDSNKLTRSDIEDHADDLFLREMGKADKELLLSYNDGKSEFESIKKRL